MSLPLIPGTDRRRVVSEDDRRTYWRYCFAGQALAGIPGDPEVNDLYAAGEDAISAANHMLAELEGGTK